MEKSSPSIYRDVHVLTKLDKMSLNFFGLTLGIILIIVQGGQSLETETSEDRRAKCTFRSSHFGFLVNFGNEVMKIRKYYVIFVYILGKMEKTERKSRN